MLLGMSYGMVQLFKWLANDLMRQLQTNADRIESIVDKDLRGILIKLIDNAKKNELRMASIERSHKAVVEIITKLSGNGLKDKFK